MENKTYYLYYNIIDNTYCIDSKKFNSEDGYDKIYKNFANIGKIELTNQEFSEIKASSNDRVYIKKENEKARKIIYGKAEGRIDFDKVQKVIAQLCYNFKVDENYKYNFKEEKKEIQIEEERNENREITTEGEKTNIYLIEYKKFEELCNNLLEIINNPPFKSEELNTKFLINYTVGLENIIINEIIKIGKDKEKTYLLLSYFSKKLLDVYDKIEKTKNKIEKTKNKIEKTKNYGKVIYINCLFSIYDKILESRNKKINYSTDYACFFKNNVIKKRLNKEKQEHFHVYEIVDKEMENSSEGENLNKNYYIVKSNKEFLNANKEKEYKYVKEIHIAKDDQKKEYEKMLGFGPVNTLSSLFKKGSVNPFGKDATVKKFIPEEHRSVKNTSFYELIERPKIDETIKKNIDELEKLRKEKEDENLEHLKEFFEEIEKEKELVQQIILPSPKPQISINKNDGIIEKIIRYLPPEDRMKTEDTGSKRLLKKIKEDICDLQINEMVDDEEKKCSEETRKSKKEIIEEIKKDKENEINEGCLKKETEYTIEAFRRKYKGQKEYEYEKEYIKGGKVKIKIKNYFGDEKDIEIITSEPLQTLENLAKDIMDGKLKQDNDDIIEEQDDKYIYKNIYENIYENIHEKKPIPNLETLEKSKDKGFPFQER